MREETHYPICPYCGKPVTPDDHPCKGLPDGRKAHLQCYVDHIDDDDSTPTQ